MIKAECSDVVVRVLTATSPSKIFDIFQELGLSHWCWVERKTDVIRLKDRMPVGFFEAYFGSNADLYCPISWALRRQKWSVFCMDQAFQAYYETGESTLQAHFQQFLANTDSVDYDLVDQRIAEASRLWENYGIKDAILMTADTPEIESFTVFAGTVDCRKIMDQYRPALIMAGDRLNQFLKDDDSLIEVPRRFFKLTERQEAVLQVHIDHPEWPHTRQATELGMSVDTLKSHHEKIAKNFGVCHFAGATVRALQSGIIRPNTVLRSTGKSDTAEKRPVTASATITPLRSNG